MSSRAVGFTLLILLVLLFIHKDLTSHTIGTTCEPPGKYTVCLLWDSRPFLILEIGIKNNCSLECVSFGTAVTSQARTSCCAKIVGRRTPTPPPPLGPICFIFIHFSGTIYRHNRTAHPILLFFIIKSITGFNDSLIRVFPEVDHSHNVARILLVDQFFN